jgi:DNA repair/transcription protein MET18/MMS19
MTVKGLQTFQSDFVFGFLQALEGEKDPRVLFIAFKLIPNIISHLPQWQRFQEVANYNHHFFFLK